MKLFLQVLLGALVILAGAFFIAAETTWRMALSCISRLVTPLQALLFRVWNTPVRRIRRHLWPLKRGPPALVSALLLSVALQAVGQASGPVSISRVTGLTTGLSRGKSLYVDATHGSNTTGTRGRSDKPYLTITAAKAAAQSGDTIYVRPGTYNEKNLLKNGVNIWGPEADVTYTSASQGGIIDDSATYGANSACTAHIRLRDINYSTSHTSQAGSYSTTPIRITNASSDVEIVCRNLKSNVASSGAQSAAVYALDGTLTIRAERKIQSLAYDAAIQEINNSSTLTLYCDELLGGDNCIEWTRGNTTIYARRAYSSGAAATINAQFDGGGATGNIKLYIQNIEANSGIAVSGIFNSNAQDVIDARYIYSASGVPMDIEDGTPTVWNARIKAGGASVGAVNLSGTPTLILSNCIVVSGASASTGVGGIGNLQMHGGATNKAKGGSVTMTAGAYPTPDTDVL